MKGENHMKRNGLVHHMIDYIKDILSQFNLGKQRETEIFMSSNDFQRLIKYISMKHHVYMMNE